MPTTIGSELAVLGAGGELLGYVGETQPNENDQRFYARSLDDQPLAWFSSKAEATEFLKGLAS